MRIVNTENIVFIAFVVISGFLVFQYPLEPIFDQRQLIQIDPTLSYPAFNSGLISALVAGFTTVMAGGIETLSNSYLRLFALVLYFGSSFWLARNYLHSHVNRSIFLLLLLLSGFPFLWLSSELIAAGMLFVSLVLIIANSHPILIGISLAIMAFTKLEMSVISITLLAATLSLPRLKSADALKIGAFAMTSFLIISPGLLQQGSSYLSTEYEDQEITRGFVSFGQHYSVLADKTPYETANFNPWLAWTYYIDRDFNGAESVLEAALNQPTHYLTFIARSIAEGFQKIIHVFHFALFAIPIAWFARASHPQNRFDQLFILSLVGLIPAILFSYPHIRYMAKYYPLAILFMLGLRERICEMVDSKDKEVLEVSTWLVIALCLGYNLILALTWQFESPGFWFPD